MEPGWSLLLSQNLEELLLKKLAIYQITLAASTIVVDSS